MDLNTVNEVVRRPSRRPGAQWSPGDAWLAGGTWLFSEPQPDVRRLVDLTALDWPALVVRDDGLEIGATCTIRDLYHFGAPEDWPAAALFARACEDFLASFKVWNSATVGGNICMSLPAGPMITLTVALEASYTLWAPDGTQTTVDAADFVTGDHQNVLGAGELLRSVHIPVEALHKRHTDRRFTLTKLGRSTVFLVGTQSRDHGDLLLTITAGTTRPVRLKFETVPDADTMREHIEAIAPETWFNDPYGSPAHRRHLTKLFAEQIRAELSN